MDEHMLMTSYIVRTSLDRISIRTSLDRISSTKLPYGKLARTLATETATITTQSIYFLTVQAIQGEASRM